MRSSARQPLQIWRVTSSRSRPFFQLTSSGEMPVAYSPSKMAAKRSRRTSTASIEMSPSSMMRKPSRRKLSTCSLVSVPALVSTPVPYPRVADLSEQSLEEFLNSVGEDTPAPGGGTSSAITAALAAALVEMSARLASDEEAAEAARGMRADALRLAEEELTSYAPVLEAETPADRTTALDAASEPPAQIAETAANVAELGVKVAGSSSPAVRGDALTG